MSDEIIKKDIKHLIEQETPNLNNLLSPEEVSDFKSMTEELRDTWTKKQMFRTETEARFSVLQDNRYPTRGAKYWQCVREQSSYLDNLMALSFDYRRNDARIKYLEKKIANETPECISEGKDFFGRTLAECFINGESLSSFLVRHGYAFAYRKYSKKFIKDEEYAKKIKIGMWAMEFEFPWDYRKNKS